MLQNVQSRRNFKSLRPWRRRKRTGKAQKWERRAANLVTVRLSSGISANILDFRAPQKHVLKDMPTWNPAARPVGGEVQAYQASKARRDRGAPEVAPAPTSGEQGNEFEVRNPACGKSGVRKGARGKARGPRLRPGLHRSHGYSPLQSGQGLA